MIFFPATEIRNSKHEARNPSWRYRSGLSARNSEPEIKRTNILVFLV